LNDPKARALMTPAEILEKFLRDRIRDMKGNGEAWGPPVALETQYLQNLEHLAILGGHPWSGVLVVWEGILQDASLNPDQFVSSQVEGYSELEALLNQLHEKLEVMWKHPAAHS
jgi:hypothetical protein